MLDSMRMTCVGALALAGVLAVAGCGGGDPAGSSSSKGSSTGSSSTSGGTGTGTGTSTGTGSSTGGGITNPVGGGASTAFRLVGWDSAKVIPILQPQGAPSFWFMASGVGGQAAQNVEILQNGQAMAVQGTPLGAGGGHMFIVPASASGTTYQVRGQVGGQTITTNTVTVNTAAFASSNTGAGGFSLTSPTDGSTQPTSTPFTYTAAGTASSYHVVALMLDRTTGQVAVQMAVETPAGSTGYTAGSGQGTSAVFVDGQLPVLPFPTSQSYAAHVVAIDANGWGIGTSVDMASASGQGGGSYSGAAASASTNPMAVIFSMITGALTSAMGGSGSSTASGGGFNPTSLFLTLFTTILGQAFGVTGTTGTTGTGGTAPSTASWPQFQVQ